MNKITCKTLGEKQLLYQDMRTSLARCAICPAAFECPDYIESNQLLKLLEIDIGIDLDGKIRDKDRPDLFF